MAIAKVIELSSSSKISFEDAIQSGIARACATLDGVKGAWIGEQKVRVVDGVITEYRVDLKVSFLLKEVEEEEPID